MAKDSAQEKLSSKRKNAKDIAESDAEVQQSTSTEKTDLSERKDKKKRKKSSSETADGNVTLKKKRRQVRKN